MGSSAEGSPELARLRAEAGANSADPVLQCRYGIALQAHGRPDLALLAFRDALTLRPDYPEAICNIGHVWHELGGDEQAVEAYRLAIGLKPGMAQAHSGLGIALLTLGAAPAALAALRRATALDPDHAGTRFNLALALLTLGELEEGWREHEWRLRLPGRPPTPVAGPAWTGDDLAGRTILLHAEQGLGDTLQCLRYAPHLAAQGARVVVEVPAPLVRLAQGVAGVAAVVDQRVAQQGGERPAFDCHCPMMSLPYRCGTRLGSIPSGGPDGKPYIADTAALVAALDLVVTVDTSVAHLAGAMGKPVWTMSRYDGCWRWLRDRDDTPWYGSMRLYRQRQSGDWADIVARVTADLATAAAHHAAAPGRALEPTA
jgi:Flp pilus assembly protein TadD